jgi:hypothetical protein
MDGMKGKNDHADGDASARARRVHSRDAVHSHAALLFRSSGAGSPNDAVEFIRRQLRGRGRESQKAHLRTGRLPEPEGETALTAHQSKSRIIFSELFSKSLCRIAFWFLNLLGSESWIDGQEEAQMTTTTFDTS